MILAGWWPGPRWAEKVHAHGAVGARENGVDGRPGTNYNTNGQ